MATFVKGRGLSKADLSRDGTRRCIHYGELFSYGEHITDVLHGTDLDGDFVCSVCNDVLMPTSDVTPNGLATASCLQRTGVILGGGILAIRVPEDVLDGVFLAYSIRHHRDQVMQLVTGTTVYHLYGRDMANFRFPVPTSEEQRTVAEALSDVDGLIESLDSLIVKKRAVKAGVMQRLLTGETRLSGFSGEWEEKRIGNICTLLSTANNPRADLEEHGEVGYVHYGNVHAHPLPVLNWAGLDLPRIDESRIGNISRLRDGDLVMVDASEDLEGLGKSVEVMGIGSDNIVAGLHTILCRGDSDHWAAGFKAYLQYIPAFKSALTRVAAGISVYAVSRKQLADIVLALPPPSEQAAIVSVLSDMDVEIAALERRLDKIRAIKQGAMQQLLTGKIRLVDPA